MREGGGEGGGREERWEGRVESERKGKEWKEEKEKGKESDEMSVEEGEGVEIEW
jgi:hypothetical protein